MENAQQQTAVNKSQFIWNKFCLPISSRRRCVDRRRLHAFYANIFDTSK